MKDCEEFRELRAALSRLAASQIGCPGPAVKAALLAEFRKQQKVTPIRRPVVKWAAIATAAAAAMLMIAWLNRPQPQAVTIATAPRPAPLEAAPGVVAMAEKRPIVRHVRRTPKRRPQRAPVAEEPVEVATDFFEIPYAVPLRADERGDVIRIEMPRAGMAVYGLPVTGGQLDARVKADVLMGEDGVARAIRFIR